MANRKPPHKIYSPAVWPTWILVALGWVIARLPLSWIFKLGTYLGRLSHRFGRSRRLITQTNIRRCFPELNQAQQELRTRRVFEAVGIGALELTIPWLNPQRDLSQRFDIFGQEHLDEAVALGRGVILVGGHYAVMDVICQYFANLKYVDVMYRANKNPVWQWLQLRGRKHFLRASSSAATRAKHCVDSSKAEPFGMPPIKTMAAIIPYLPRFLAYQQQLLSRPHALPSSITHLYCSCGKLAIRPTGVGKFISQQFWIIFQAGTIAQTQHILTAYWKLISGSSQSNICGYINGLRPDRSVRAPSTHATSNPLPQGSHARPGPKHQPRSGH